VGTCQLAIVAGLKQLLLIMALRSSLVIELYIHYLQVWDKGADTCIRWHVPDAGAGNMGVVAENSLIHAAFQGAPGSSGGSSPRQHTAIAPATAPLEQPAHSAGTPKVVAQPQH
jgi:hypothetical protein